MFREGIPQARGGGTKGSVPNCASLGPWRKEPVSVCGMERMCCDLWSKEFFKVGGSISMDTLMCEEKDFIFDPSRNWKPM